MATTSPSRHLTNRDEEVLLALDRCPLTVTQLLKLSSTFKSRMFTRPRSVQDRLQKLKGAGWVQSWPYATVSRGGSPDYYKLTLLGFHMLHGHNAPPRTKRQFAELSVGHHHHTHSLANSSCTASSPPIAAASSSGISTRRIRCPLPIDGETLLPRFRLRVAHPRRSPVQLHRGTRQRHRAGSLGQDTESWQKRIRLYNVLQDRNYPDRFRVLVVCTRCSGRLRSILKLRRGTRDKSTAGTHLRRPPRPVPQPARCSLSSLLS